MMFTVVVDVGYAANEGVDFLDNSIYNEYLTNTSGTLSNKIDEYQDKFYLNKTVSEDPNKNAFEIIAGKFEDFVDQLRPLQAIGWFMVKAQFPIFTYYKHMVTPLPSQLSFIGILFLILWQLALLYNWIKFVFPSRLST